jgi:predicted nucleotidyltransferase
VSYSLVTLDSMAVALLMQRFVPAEAVGVMLMGSRARGNAGPFSDVDWVRVARDDEGFPDDGSYLIDGRLVVVSTMTPAKLEETFNDPKTSCDNLMGLRAAQILLDREGELARLQRRARDFVWDAAMQSKANLWAAEQMVGIIEEAHKGLEGLRRNDVGRLLNARFGLSWILSAIIKVQRGILLTSDNGTWDELNRAVGETTPWVRYRWAAFGVDDGSGLPPTLPNQVVAGLRLYVETAKLIDHALPVSEGKLVRATVARIEEELMKKN